MLRELERRLREGDRAPYKDYRKAADQIYARYDDPPSRYAAFQALHSRIFEERGCGRPIVDTLEALALDFDVVLVMRAWSPAEEEADLGPGGRTLGIRLMVERFDSADLSRFLPHELGHVIDMLDPTFQYGRAATASAPAARQRISERFRLLWDCVVDGRTVRAGGQPLADRLERCAEFVRLFPEFPHDAAEIVVGLLWDGARPTFLELAAFARDPLALAAWGDLSVAAGTASAQSAEWAVPVPGAPCPLCGFPTYAWERIPPGGVVAQISADFPTWTPALGACQRCVEGYAAMAEVGGAR